ncbi:MAG TPA: hypothetical protein VFW96_08410, partial [Thermomicrobiales bacterium]|nr:hypothetical protein [Thermomicrobiales bacterium]
MRTGSIGTAKPPLPHLRIAVPMQVLRRGARRAGQPRAHTRRSPFARPASLPANAPERIRQQDQ